MNEYLQVAQALGLTPLNIILIAMLYFVGAKIGLFPKFWNREEQAEPTPLWAESLLQHFNHETTEQNMEANIALKEIKETQRDILNMIRDGNRLQERVIILLENFDKYGIPCRKVQ